MSQHPPKAPTKRAPTGKNPGASVFNRIYSKRNPRPIHDFSDEELLEVVLGSRTAARSVLSVIGSLEHYSSIGSGSKLLDHPGISKATAARLDAFFEAACRVG